MVRQGRIEPRRGSEAYFFQGLTKFQQNSCNYITRGLQKHGTIEKQHNCTPKHCSLWFQANLQKKFPRKIVTYSNLDLAVSRREIWYITCEWLYLQINPFQGNWKLLFQRLVAYLHDIGTQKQPVMRYQWERWSCSQKHWCIKLTVLWCLVAILRYSSLCRNYKA